MVSLNDRKWKEFRICDIYADLHIAKSIDFGKTNKGENAFVGRSAENNGIQGFVKNDVVESGNCITVGMVGSLTAFYQPKDFVASQNILIHRSNKINAHNSLFISSIINRFVLDKYSYGRPLKLSSYPDERILLPIDSEGEPDWLFMENYIKQLESNQKEEYKNFATKKLRNLEYKEIPALKEKTWKAFRISELFEIENCKCSNISSLKNGDVPYIGATNRNNGILKFVENRKDLLTKGRCIVFICDGEGSIGYSTYQDADFIGSTTLKVGRNSNMNKYHIMFISTISDKVRTKYNFGYKRTTAHLKNEMILLPLWSDNTPDYDYMEHYIKNVMYRQLTSYLEICK